MKRRVLLWLGLAAAVWTTPAAAAGQKLYAVVFEVKLGEGGALETVKVEHVTDASGKKLHVDVPRNYVEAARDRLGTMYRGRPADRFWTFLLFDPIRPNDADPDSNSPPAADERRTVSLKAGETVTIRLGADGRIEAGARGETSDEPHSQVEEVIVRAMVSGALEGRTEGGLGESSRKDLPEKAAPPERAVRLAMKRAPDGGTVLVVENGYDAILYYRGWMTVGGKSGATSVCEVVPNVLSVEHWPSLLDRLDLSGFGLRKPGQGQEIECR